MSFSQGPNEANNPDLFTTSGQIRPDLSPNRLRELLRQRYSQPGSNPFGRDGVGGIAGLLGTLIQQPQPQGSNLPALPQIPELTKAPSRLNTRQIAAAARRQRVIASKRKGRASTILGGSIGAVPERKNLLGV